MFELSPKAGNIKKVRVASAGLTNMTAAPVAAPLNAELPLAGVAQSDGLTIAGGSFSPPDKDLNTSAAAVVLPRMAGKFDFELDVSFNDMADAKFTAAMPGDARICSRHTIYVHPEDERQLHATDADGGALG